MEDVRTRSKGTTVLTILLVMILVASGGVGAWLISDYVRSGGMGPRWVYHSTDNSAFWLTPFLVSRNGLLIASEHASDSDFFVSLSPSNGTVEWKTHVNVAWSLVQGPNGGFYYIDFPDRSVWENNASSASHRNLTALDSSGRYNWSYVADNGTLDIWGVYPDGEVVASWTAGIFFGESVKDEIVGISNGVKMWGIDMPFRNASWGTPSISDNGTFVVHAYCSEDARYEVGISERGQVLYLQKGSYFIGDPEPSRSRNGSVEYELRRTYVDSVTSVISVYAISIVNGSVLWNTELYQSGNPNHMPPGSWEPHATLVDGRGIIYCSDEKNSYALDSAGKIIWKKPYLGWQVAAFPLGGFLAQDNVSLKRFDSNGLQVWRHYVSLNGYSSVFVGPDETVYYSQGASIVALTRSTGLSLDLVFLIVTIGADVAAVSGYVLARRRKRFRGSS